MVGVEQVHLCLDRLAHGVDLGEARGQVVAGPGAGVGEQRTTERPGSRTGVLL